MRVAVIGGETNGVIAAWQLARRRCDVQVCEKSLLISATRRAATTMLPDGLSCTQYGNCGLVREVLWERRWWIAQGPQLARLLQVLQAVLLGQCRPRWQVALGDRRDEISASGSDFRRLSWYPAAEVSKLLPFLADSPLRGAYTDRDVQIADYPLGLWGVEPAGTAGARLREAATIEHIAPDRGSIQVNGDPLHFDRFVNGARRWAVQLLPSSTVQSECRPDLLRGSHVAVFGSVSKGCVPQFSREQPLLRVLPSHNNIPLGTTEVRQEVLDSAAPRLFEGAYPRVTYNRLCQKARRESDISERFSTVRPSLTSMVNHSTAGRNSFIEWQERPITVLGGKLTTPRPMSVAIGDATLH